ncbi:hypothetical protein BDR22DRAFT_230902 [Usnea florida]
MELEHQKKHTRWLCRSRHQTKQIFDREEELVEHMRESHGGSFTEAMLPRLISRGALPAPHIFTCCPLCGYIPEEDNMEHASKETSRQLLSHIGQHLEIVALSALPDVLFDSSERSIRSRSSMSSSDGSNSTRRDYLSDQSEIQYSQNEDSMPTEDYLISETEAEDWAWVYRKWSLDPKSPKPFNCPYSKDKLFIDRPKLFRQLTDMLNYSSNERGVRPGPAILIHGPRGAGKSQLAVKYAHRVHRGRKDMSVFWFFGRTMVDFENSSLSPMDNRLLSKAKTDGLEWATRAHSWLQDEKKGEWLAVIDDACLGIDPSSDEEESFWQLVEKAIPICSHGTLLITSRKRPRAGFRNYRTLEVGKMTTEESHALVRAMFLPNDVEEQEVAALANIEERTPLALIEAVDGRHPRLPESCIMLSSLWSGITPRPRQENTSSVGISGADVIEVLGVISSIIAIVNDTKNIYDAATNPQGLPEAFREVAGRLPIIESILRDTKQNIKEGKVENDSCKGVKHIVEACEEKAKHSKELFDKVIPADGASDLKRYYKAVKAWGKRSEVEILMKGMLEDVQILACECGMETATKAQQEQIIKAFTEIAAVAPSVPEHEIQETGIANTNYGSGTAQACLSALFLTDPRDDRAEMISIKGPKVESTCQWIRSDAIYDSWLHSRSQLLWLSGGPGQGKTMLSIFVAEELEKTATSQNEPFLQYFCDMKDERRNTAVAVLRGLIWQLLQFRPKLFDHILPTFRREKQSLFSLEMLWKIFESMVYDPAIGTTYCVLDGVDECEANSLEILLRKFAALFSAKTDQSSACHLNLLVASRSFPDFIPNLLSSFPRISLDADASPEVNKDINIFIEAKVEELSEDRQYPEALREHVAKVFRDLAGGSFLWIGIVAKELANYKASEVEEALEGFPPGLDEVYSRALLHIDSGRRSIAARILRWVVMAVRPLTLLELSLAIEPTVGSSIVTNRDERIRDQISYCGYFLVIKQDEVGLFHPSARDYLLRTFCDSNPELEFFRVKEDVANLEIARRCMDYLQSGALETSIPDVLRDEEHLSCFPLLSYAVLHWHEHARLLPRSADIFDLSHPFWKKKSELRTSWLKAYWDHELKYLYHDGPPESFPKLHLASFFGIFSLVEKVLYRKGLMNKIKRTLVLNKVDSQGMTALMWAASRGHEAVVRLLLELGPDKQERALIVAAESGHKAIVQYLLENIADVDAKDLDGETALMKAAKRGHEALIQLLLKQGTDVTIRNRDGETALMGAAQWGNEAVTQLLLENGADVHAVSESGETALSRAAAASYKNSEATIRLLLEKGADINAVHRFGETALMRAACFPENSEAIVRLLLEKGADINAADDNGQTALMGAALSGNEAIVRLLLEKGADINATDNLGETALMRAAEGFFESSEATIRLLLEKGADINAADIRGKTALAIAVRMREKAEDGRLMTSLSKNHSESDAKHRVEVQKSRLDSIIQMLTLHSQTQSSL